MSKKKRGTTKRNIGLIETYNFYHGYQPNHHINIDVVQKWYPQSVIEQKYYILAKVFKLNNEKDNCQLQSNQLESERLLVAMHMTYETPNYIDCNGLTKYDNSIENMQSNIYRAMNRFDEMKTEGLLSGTITHPCITWKVVEKLNAAINPDNQELQMLLQSLQQIADSANENFNALESKIDSLVNKTKISTVKECIDIANESIEVVKHIETGITVISPAFSALHKLLAQWL